MLNRFFIHAAFWIAYLLLNVRLQAFDPDSSFWALLQGEAVTMIPKISLTYFIFYWSIPRFLEGKKRLSLVFQMVVAFVAAVLLYRWLIVDFVVPALHPDLVGKVHFLDDRNLWWTAWDIFITVAAASAIKLFRLFERSQKHEQELQKEKLTSELNFLRAQTNPHFLFNTLNNLYVLAWKKSEKTPQAIMQLSKIMRFVLYDCREKRIELAAEAQVIREYVELEKLRFNDRLRVEHIEIIDRPSQPIAPLLLLPFVENAFKHGGKGTTGEAKIQIRLELEDEKLLFSVENNLESDSPRGPAKGIGLENVRRQLELIYANRFDLQILPENDRFKIQLRVNLGGEEITVPK